MTDLTPAFDWNIKQLFVFLVVEYESKKNVRACARVARHWIDTVPVCIEPSAIKSTPTLQSTFFLLQHPKQNKQKN